MKEKRRDSRNKYKYGKKLNQNWNVKKNMETVEIVDCKKARKKQNKTKNNLYNRLIVIPPCLHHKVCWIRKEMAAEN